MADSEPSQASTLSYASGTRIRSLPAPQHSEQREPTIFQESEYGIKGYDTAGTLRAGRIPEHQMVVAPTLSASNDASRSPQSAEVTAQIEAVLKATSQEEGLDPVAFTASEQANSYAWERPVYPTLTAKAPNDTSNIQQGIRHGGAVRRLTPIECERLQGFPDNWTEGLADSHCYRQMGNAVTVNVAHYIGWLLADA